MVSQMIVGIDPGVRGAIAVLDGDTIDAFNMPMQDKLINIRTIIDWFGEDVPRLVVVERMVGFGKGHAANWCRQGTYYGQLIGWLQAVKWPFLPITPATWKRATVGLKKPKEASVFYVKNLFPNAELGKNKDKAIGRADAICLALYGRRFLNE